jgi:Trk-type K+ transport system membrane component
MTHPNLPHVETVLKGTTGILAAIAVSLPNWLQELQAWAVFVTVVGGVVIMVLTAVSLTLDIRHKSRVAKLDRLREIAELKNKAQK